MHAGASCRLMTRTPPMPKAPQKSTAKSAAVSKTAKIHDQKLSRGEGGELHQTAAGATPVLTTAQGGPVSDDQNSLKAGRRGPTAARGLPFPRKDLPLRPRAHSGARGACPRLRRARLF